jgi:hypothetical protein
MGRQEGALPISGTIGNLSFYYDRIHGYLVRRKGGASKEKIKHDPVFERTRENNSEFALAQKAGKLIRTAVRMHLAVPRDSTIARRLAQRLLRIKALDTVSPRGERTVANGLNTSEGRELLSTVAFHEGCLLQDVLKRKIVFHAAGGTFSITQLDPATDFVRPAAATHVKVQAAAGLFDFANDRYTMTKTAAVELALNGVSHDLVLELAGMPEGNTGGDTGTMSLQFVSVVFLQEQNGERYVLREGSSLGILNPPTSLGTSL